jgi:hypothetical protein
MSFIAETSIYSFDSGTFPISEDPFSQPPPAADDFLDTFLLQNANPLCDLDSISQKFSLTGVHLESATLESPAFPTPPTAPSQVHQLISSNGPIVQKTSKDPIVDKLQEIMRNPNNTRLQSYTEWIKPLHPLVAGNLSTILNEITRKEDNNSPRLPSSNDNDTNPDNNENNSIPNKKIRQSNHGRQMVNLSQFGTMPQTEAARSLGIATSSLSKKWKEATNSRKWPFRTIMKIDKEIMALMNNIKAGQPLDAYTEFNLGILLRRRQQELVPVVVPK